MTQNNIENRLIFTNLSLGSMKVGQCKQADKQIDDRPRDEKRVITGPVTSIKAKESDKEIPCNGYIQIRSRYVLAIHIDIRVVYVENQAMHLVAK